MSIYPLAAAVACVWALSGCEQLVQPFDIALAEELCAKRGGFTHVTRPAIGEGSSLRCKDGTFINVYPGKRAPQ